MYFSDMVKLLWGGTDELQASSSRTDWPSRILDIQVVAAVGLDGAQTWLELRNPRTCSAVS